MDQRQSAEAMAQFGSTTLTEKEILVRRIDADIRKLQEWRAYVLGDSATATEPAASKVRKARGLGKKKAGLPATEEGGTL